MFSVRIRVPKNLSAQNFSRHTTTPYMVMDKLAVSKVSYNASQKPLAETIPPTLLQKACLTTPCIDGRGEQLCQTAGTRSAKFVLILP